MDNLSLKLTHSELRLLRACVNSHEQVLRHPSVATRPGELEAERTALDVLRRKLMQLQEQVEADVVNSLVDAGE
jgi:molybdenum-dependent DNA-binding transcriptional regulator ModE